MIDSCCSLPAKKTETMIQARARYFTIAIYFLTGKVLYVLKTDL
jgi:hypothetical protein